MSKSHENLSRDPQPPARRSELAYIAMRLALAIVAIFCSLDLVPQVQADSAEYVLRSGDVISISVFQSPELTTKARISESGSISFPLIGTVAVGGMTQPAAEKSIANKLSDGGFLVKPQVNIFALEMNGNQIAVLGQVNKPGRYPLATSNTRLSDILATAGGIAPAGSDVVLVTGSRAGQPLQREIDTSTMLESPRTDDIVLEDGDTVYVRRAPTFYIHGEVQKPGAIRLERGMTVVQALASGGGVTPRGTLRGLTIQRRDDKGNLLEIKPKMNDYVVADDVIYVKESLF